MLLILAKRRLTPERYKIRQGKSVTFICMSDSMVTWKFQNDRLQRRKGVKMKHSERKSTLVLKNITPEYDGEYTCIGYEWGIEFFESAIIDVMRKILL